MPRLRIALYALELRELLLEQPAPIAEAARRFERLRHECPQLAPHGRQSRRRRPFASQLDELRLQPIHPLGDVFELVHQRLHAPRPQAQLLHQSQHLSPPPNKPSPGLHLRLAVDAPIRQHGIIPSLSPHERPQRRQVLRHPRRHLRLREPLGERHLDRPVERQLAALHALQDRHRVLQREERPQDVPPEPLAGQLDLLGQRDFLVPRQQRNPAHLRQVHADRVVRQLRQILR
jgi:hypothetical protein